MNFIFYDAEATGPEPRHDQMLQFAAVLTDQELKERDRFVMRCRLLPHRLPAPVALILTARSMPDITDRTLPSHYEMMSALRQRLRAWSPAVFAGYSSLEFDEPLLRQALRACLFPPDQSFEEVACATMGVFAPLVGIIGTMQAAEALKLLTGVGRSLAGRLLMLDGRSMHWDDIAISRQAGCPVCGVH